MRLIELCGPSGAGKSTVYAELLKLGGLTPNPKPSLEQAIIILNEAQVNGHRDITAFRDLICRFFATAKGERLDVRYSFAVRTLAKTALARLDEGPPMVVDGGLVHRGMSALSRLTSDVPMSEYYRLLPAPDLICMFVAPKEVLEERNKTRGHDDRSHEVELSLQKQEESIKAIDARGLNMMMVSSLLPVERNAACIKAEIDALG